MTFWQWRCWRVRARGKYSPPRNSVMFCLSLSFLLSIFLFYLCLCVCSISRNSVCSAFNGQDKNTQSWGLWLSHSITGTKCLFSVCLYVCFLFVYVFFLAFFTFVSYLFVLVSCLSVRLFLIWLCESVSFLCLFICPFLVFLRFLSRGSGFLFGAVLAAPSVPHLGAPLGSFVRGQGCPEGATVPSWFVVFGVSLGSFGVLGGVLHASFCLFWPISLISSRWACEVEPPELA